MDVIILGFSTIAFGILWLDARSELKVLREEHREMQIILRQLRGEKSILAGALREVTNDVSV